MKLLITLCALVALTFANKINYEGYKVIRFIPNNDEQRNVLLDMEKNNPGVIFWKGVRAVGLPVDICFPPHLQGDMVQGLSRSGMSVTEFIPNVQTLIDEEAASIQGPGARLNWNSYPTLDVLFAFLDEKVAEHPSLASVETIGTSYEGRPLKVMTIGAGAGKQIVWLDANIHAREWITNAVCTYVIEALLNDPELKHMRDAYEWRIMPMMNPDGYAYTHSSDRLWRKTRTVNIGSNCLGADPNRNWAYKWMHGGASNNPCSDTYGGSRAFSEVETEIVSEYIKGFTSRLVFYLSLHSYSQLILLPYGHENARYPDYNKYMEIANKAAIAHRARHGTNFRHGNIVDLLYVASGGSMDWAKGTYDTKLAYTYELRDTGNFGFLLPPTQIIPSGNEFIDGLQVLIHELGLLLSSTTMPIEEGQILPIEEGGHKLPEIVAPGVLPIVGGGSIFPIVEGGNKLPEVGGPSIKPIVTPGVLPIVGGGSIYPIAEGGNKLPEVGGPSIKPIGGGSILPVEEGANTLPENIHAPHNFF